MEAIAWPALRAFLSMLVPMVALLAAGRLDLVAGAVFGALTSVYCRSEPYRQQARTLAAVAVTMVVSVAIGDLIAVHGPSGPWQEALSLLATALVGAITTAAATASWPALCMTPPITLMPVFPNRPLLRAAIMQARLRIPPAREYSMDDRFPKVSPVRTIRVRETAAAGTGPSENRQTIVTRFASPSLMPGTPKLIGMRVSI